MHRRWDTVAHADPYMFVRHAMKQFPSFTFLLFYFYSFSGCFFFCSFLFRITKIELNAHKKMSTKRQSNEMNDFNRKLDENENGKWKWPKIRTISSSALSPWPIMTKNSISVCKQHFSFDALYLLLDFFVLPIWNCCRLTTNRNSIVWPKTEWCIFERVKETIHSCFRCIFFVFFSYEIAIFSFHFMIFICFHFTICVLRN